MKTKKINGKTYKILVTRQEIIIKVREIAKQIISDFKDIPEPPVLLFVLTGGIYFGDDLSQELDEAEFQHSVDTVGLKRYAGDENGGLVTMTSLPRTNLGGKNIIVIEDVVDIGETINFLNIFLKNLEHAPKSIKYCAMLLKEHHKELNFTINYLGWRIGSPWIVGKGMDSNGLFRGLKDLWVCID